VQPYWLHAYLLVYTPIGLFADSRVTAQWQQYVLGALTFTVLYLAALKAPKEQRVQVWTCVVVATCFEIFGSLVWGVYRYRLHNLPLFIPPAHGLVYLSGLALVGLVRTRWLVVAAAVGSIGWGLAGLTVLPRLDMAGAFGVPLLCVFLWRSRFRAAYAGVFLVVAALELYGTTIGTWRWAVELPGLGIPDGNPPSGVASGYVWFDVMALLVAPWLVYAAGRLKPKLATRSSGDFRSSKRRIEPSGMISASGSSSSART